MYVFQRWKISLKLIFIVKVLKSILTCFSVSVFFHFITSRAHLLGQLMGWGMGGTIWRFNYGMVHSKLFKIFFNSFFLLNFIHFDILMVCVSIDILYTFQKFKLNKELFAVCCCYCYCWICDGKFFLLSYRISFWCSWQ